MGNKTYTTPSTKIVELGDEYLLSESMTKSGLKVNNTPTNDRGNVNARGSRNSSFLDIDE